MLSLVFLACPPLHSLFAMNDDSINSLFYQAHAPINLDVIDDLTACDRDPVNFCGAIMPQGALLVLDHQLLIILGASANTATFLGVDVEQLLGKSLGYLFATNSQQKIETSLADLPVDAVPSLLGCFTTLHSSANYSLLAHRSGDVFLLEFEVIAADITATSMIEHSARVNSCLKKLQSAGNWQMAMQVAVNELKNLTGFDAVIGVRFFDDGSFRAVAEAREDSVPAYLDKYFPRSDIPEPARQQMLRMRQQYLSDILYEPVPIVMAITQNSLAIDLAMATLRSVSPFCRRFYQNMGVRSRLLLTLVDNGKLWGFINCRSDQPRTVAYSDRQAYQSFTDMATLLLVEKEKAEQQQHELQSKQRIWAIATELSAAKDFKAALFDLPARMMDILDAAGVALVMDGRIISIGRVPEQSFILSLIPWLKQQPDCFTTDCLPSLFPLATDFCQTVCGLLVVPLSKSEDYLLAFRPEWVREVNWAGNPQKSVEIDALNGELRMTPRGSFETWKQVVAGRARPWASYEKEAAMNLRKALIDVQQLETNRILKDRVEQSNQELESFAYSVAHDLQEPLRGIRNFAELLNQQDRDHLLAEDRAWLQVIMALSMRMYDKINVLLDYSRANKQVLELCTNDLNHLLQTVQQNLSLLILETHVQIKIPRLLPSLFCDAVRMQAIFENLITNAIKYNDKADKHIEIGYLEETPFIFYVRDNGIGIKEEHQQAIFTLFRRLHGRDDYGGGTGAGLAIAHKHIDRQGGRIWLESVPGQGTTFYFTIAPERELKKAALKQADFEVKNG